MNNCFAPPTPLQLNGLWQLGTNYAVHLHHSLKYKLYISISYTYIAKIQNVHQNLAKSNSYD